MNRIDRLMGIITVLQSRRHHSVEDLSAQFGISVRTVYRDLSALGEIGVPVTFEPGKGYGLVQGFFLPPVVFTNEEANALALVEALVMRFGDRGVQKHYASALTKVRAVLRGDQKDQAEELRDHLKAMRPHCLNDDYDHLARIQQSIAERHLLWMQYQNYAGEDSTREVEPIGLIFYSLEWHMIAWCWKREAYRDFRVSRITTLRNSRIPFRKKDHLPLSEYQVTGWRGGGESSIFSGQSGVKQP